MFSLKLPAELLYQNGSVSRYRSRKLDGIDSLQNNVVCFHWIGSRKWRSSSEQFKHEHAERPVVSTDIVAPVQYHFWGYVFRCTAERPRLSAMLQSLGKAEVYEFYIPKSQIFKISYYTFILIKQAFQRTNYGSTVLQCFEKLELSIILKFEMRIQQFIVYFCSFNFYIFAI